MDDRTLRLLWGVDAPPTRGPKARWTLPDVAGKAVALADRGGLESVSLAKVAADLGVTTTAIYRYVDSKDILVTLMVDEAIGDPPELTAGDLAGRCRQWVQALRERYRLHPWLVDVQPTGIPRQPRPFAWIEALVVGTACLLGRVGEDGPRVWQTDGSVCYGVGEPDRPVYFGGTP